jgi:hypothetical protein
LGEGGSFDDLTPEQQKVVLANINDPNYNSEETEERVIGDDNPNKPFTESNGQFEDLINLQGSSLRPPSPDNSAGMLPGTAQLTRSGTSPSMSAGANFVESLGDSDTNLSDSAEDLTPNLPPPGFIGGLDSGTMVNPQFDLLHYGNDELIRRAIENGSLPLNQLTDEQQKALKVGPYAETPVGEETPVEEEPLYPEQGMGGEPSIPRDQLPDNKEDLLLGIENGTIDFRAVPTSVFNELDINQTEITNATTVFAEGMEGTPPERLGEATDDERKQQLIDGVANGDIDPLLISKGELTALGIEGKDLVLPAPSEDFITKTREKIMGTIGDLADDLGPAIAKAAAPPSLEEMLDPNNGAAWQIGVRIDANGDSQLFVKIGLPIPGLTGDGWEIDLTKDGQLVIDDAIKRKAGEIWENTKKIPEKIGGWWGGVKQEIEDAGEDIKDAALDKDGNVLITVIESTGKVVKRVLRPLEIFLPQVDLSKDPMYGAKVRNGVLGIFILGKIADKIKNKGKPASSPPAGSPPEGSPPAEFDGVGDLGPPPNNNPFVTRPDTEENDPDDDKPSSSLPIPPDGGPTIPPDSGADADAGGGNNPFFSIPGGSNRNRRTEEYESKEGGALEYFFNMAGTSIFATAEQEADFLSAYMRIMDRRKAEDREVSPDKLVSPLTGVNISNPNKKTSEEDEPITVQKASGGLINGNFMNEYNRIMRHRVG